MSNKEDILKSLEPLFQKAKEKHLWFYSWYSGRWFSPEELEEQHKQGNFIWGVFNWVLDDPFNEIDRMVKMKTELNEKIINFRSRIEKKL